MQKPITYKPASAAVKKRFLKGGASLGQKREEPKDADNEETEPEQQTELLEGPFEIIEPIDTLVGPIGKFIMEPENFPLHPSVILYGKRRTGKTFTLRDIMYHCFRDIPFGICMSGTSYNGFWQEYIPATLVFQGLKPEMMQKIIERQKRLIKRFEKEHPDKDYKTEPSLRAFIIFGNEPLNYHVSSLSPRVWPKELQHNACDLVWHVFPGDTWTVPLPEGTCSQIAHPGGLFHRSRSFAHFETSFLTLSCR